MKHIHHLITYRKSLLSEEYLMRFIFCHYIALTHLFNQNFWRSSKLQGCTSNTLHWNICLKVSGMDPQDHHSHVVSPLKYFHLLRCSLLHATPVHNLLRHLHAAQGLVFPFAKLSSRLTAQLCDAKVCGVSIHYSGWLFQGSQQVVRS